MHYNFETKAAPGPSLGLWDVKGRGERLLVLGLGGKVVSLGEDGVVNIYSRCFDGKRLSGGMGVLGGSKRTTVRPEGT